MSNVRISELTAGAALTGAELFEMTQASNSRSTTAAAIVTLSATWTADQQAAGFDIKDISNVEFRLTTGAPAGTVRSIYADAAGVHVNALVTTEFIVDIAGTAEFSVGATLANFKGNNIDNVADFTLTGNINFPDGVRQTFNPDNTNSGLNVGSNATDPTTPTNGDIFYNSTSNTFRLRQNGAWIEIGSGGLVSINGDTTAAQVIQGTANRITVNTAAGTTTIDIGTDVVTLTAAQTLTNKTIAAASNTITIASTDLTDSADLVRDNAATTYTAGARQDFLGLLAGTAGLNVGGIAGAPTTQVNGDLWYDTNTNQLFGRINGANVDLGVQATEIFTWTNNHNANTFALIDPLFADPTDTTKRLDVDLAGNATTVVLTLDINQSSSQTLTVPNITGADSLVTNNFAATLTNKTFNSGTSFTSAPSISDGIRWIFNPDNTNSGINVGANATDPTSPVDGDIYYQTGTGFRARDNAAWITLGQPDTPWTVEHDANRQRFFNLGAVEWSTAGPLVNPAGTVPYIIFDDALTPDAFQINVPTANEIILSVNNTEEYTFSSSTLNMNLNTITNSGNITINVTGTTGIMTVGRSNEVAAQNAGELRYRGGNTDYASIFSNMVVATGGSERGNLDFRVKVGNTTTLDNVLTLIGGTTATSSTINFGAVMGTQINMNGFNVDNVAILLSNGSNVANGGFVRMEPDEYIAWRNNGDSNDNGITFNTADQIEFSIGNLTAADYTFSSTVFDLIGRRIEQLLHIQDASQNEQLIFGTVASAVNELTITNAATGNRPILAASGSDANVGLELRVKAQENMIFTNDGNEELLQLNQVVGAATNFVQITNAITATGPIITAEGSDTNVVLNLTGKGTGSVVHLTSVNYNATTELTISTGAITKTQSFHRVDTEADAASDNLDTINGGTEGDVLVLRSENSARTVVVTEAGNIVLEAAGNFSMDNVQDTISLIFDGSNWLELSRSNNT